MQVGLGAYLHHYSKERPHQGMSMSVRTTSQAFAKAAERRQPE